MKFYSLIIKIVYYNSEHFQKWCVCVCFDFVSCLLPIFWRREFA